MRVELEKGGRCRVGSNHVLIFKLKFIIFEKIKFKFINTMDLKFRLFIFLFIRIFILLSRESDGAPYELALELPTICLPHLDGGIPFGAFLNGTTSEVAG